VLALANDVVSYMIVLLGRTKNHLPNAESRIATSKIHVTKRGILAMATRKE